MTYRRIHLATDLVEGSDPPWFHALRIASSAGVPLSVMHAGTVHPWSRLRPAEDYLLRWGRPPLEVERLALSGAAPRALREALSAAASDLLVLGSHRARGMRRWLTGSVAERALRERAAGACLVVPDGVRPLVDGGSGAVDLQRVLVAVDCDGAGHQQLAVDHAVRLLDALGVAEAELVLLHRPVGGCPMAPVTVPSDLRVREEVIEASSTVGALLEGAVRHDVGLIVMVSHGHDTVEDVLLGSHADQVLRETPVPLLVVRA